MISLSGTLPDMKEKYWLSSPRAAMFFIKQSNRISGWLADSTQTCPGLLRYCKDYSVVMIRVWIE